MSAAKNSPRRSLHGWVSELKRPSLLKRPHFGDDLVPPKLRELVAELERAGFTSRGGKGSHRNFVHPKVSKPITISGAPGDDAKHYQVRAVKRAVEESKS